MSVMGKFKLTDEDMCVISIAKNTVRRFLKNPQLMAQEVIGLGNALYALERLPLVTPGAFSEFGVVCRNGNEDSNWMGYVNFLISDSAFTVSKGGSIFDKELGSDSFSEPGWEVELDGCRNTDFALLFNLDDDITEYLESGAAITVSDDSQINYEWKASPSPTHEKVAPLRFVVRRKKTVCYISSKPIEETASVAY